MKKTFEHGGVTYEWKKHLTYAPLVSKERKNLSVGEMRCISKGVFVADTIEERWGYRVIHWRLIYVIPHLRHDETKKMLERFEYEHERRIS